MSKKKDKKYIFNPAAACEAIYDKGKYGKIRGPNERWLGPSKNLELRYT